MKEDGAIKILEDKRVRSIRCAGREKAIDRRCRCGAAVSVGAIYPLA
ncbi:hypothetical protein BN938_2024 [Mucinivorans hirudinis]|uniref:Uncharacterized protein n=1 Tax=Mucinivorans hirudinis TaxID=1433126 RepID=A0A060R971_9BACT|nr:hypothetical protein BN938_2024 [Mucinivorans hirudinis]